MDVFLIKMFSEHTFFITLSSTGKTLCIGRKVVRVCRVCETPVLISMPPVHEVDQVVFKSWSDKWWVNLHHPILLKNIQLFRLKDRQKNKCRGIGRRYEEMWGGGHEWNLKFKPNFWRRRRCVRFLFQTNNVKMTSATCWSNAAIFDWQLSSHFRVEADEEIINFVAD